MEARPEYNDGQIIIYDTWTVELHGPRIALEEQTDMNWVAMDRQVKNGLLAYLAALRVELDLPAEFEFRVG